MAKPKNRRALATQAPTAFEPPATPPASEPPAAPPVIELPVEPPASDPVASAIRMVTGMEGPGVSWLPRQVLMIGGDLDEAQAGRLVDAGYAERI